MPPKQKEVKKGPAYKTAIPLKDIVPADIKEPPREPKPLKTPESFSEPPKNGETLPAIFEEWPSEQVVKAHDFGLNAQARFCDPVHDIVAKYLSSEAITEWKPMNELEFIEFEQEGEEQHEVIPSQAKNEIVSFKSIDKEQKDQNGPPCVIQTFMRPQSELEMQARLKEEAEKAEKAAKDKKKIAKKQEPKEQGPLQVSDVKMEDILTTKFMAQASIWIGSQLQIIKQRNLVDVNNNQAIWKKIYPQENGVPQLTKSGKYWVKLFYMGKYIKIEVDDRIPVDEYTRPMFPLSEKLNEKWTLILTKALIKYLSKTSKDGIVGNGLVIYALTGMLSENISLWQYKEWQKLQELLSNEHYERKDVVVGCFSSTEKQFKKIIKVKIEGQAINEGNQEEIFSEREIDTRTINGYSYCIGDYFDNGNFNMVFSQEKTQKEMTLKHQYNQLCKVSISNKTREEKLQYRKKKKELKEKLAIEQKKRLDLINKAPTHYHFLKLLSNLKMNCEYSQKQILLAKKCIVNKLSQPPNYDIPMEKEEKDIKSQTNVSVSLIKYKEQSELFPNIHDFSTIPNLTELLQRKEQGVWINDTDLLEYFDYLQVLYNPNIFPNKKIQTVESQKTNDFTFDENKEILVVQKIDQQQEQQKTIRLLFGFAYQQSPHDVFSPYTILEKFDFDSFRSTSNVVTLDKNIASTLIGLKNQNSVFKLNTMSKGNFTYWISSDSTFKMQSIAEYLCEYEGYNKKNITFDYAAVQAGSYLPLARIKMTQNGEDPNTILVKALNGKQELMNCLSFRIVSLPKQGKPLTSQQTEGIIQRTQEKTLIAYEYSRFIIEPQVEYFFIVEVNSADNIPDGNLQLLLLSKSEGFNAELCQQTEPVKIIEKYAPNKYGRICKERIFANNDSNVTLSLKLAEFEQVQGGGGGGKGAKKGGKDEPATELIDKPFSQQRHIIARLICNDQVLYETTGINQVTIPNFKFQSTKANPNKEYYLESKFDLRIWPEAALKSQQTQKICWVVQVAATDTVAFVRDTKQEDKEKQIRKSWEDSEPGRAERARKSRRRFLIEIKKERGEQLTEEEQQIINAPRLTRKQLLEEEKKNEDNKKGGKGAKKDDKKGGKDAKKDEPLQEKPVERQPPRSGENFMNQIKQFLGILENCLVRYEPLEEGEPRIRSPEQIRSIREAAIMAGENRVGKIIRSIQNRQTIKIKQKEKKQTISIFFSELRSQLKQKYAKYIEWRNQDIEKDKLKQDKERYLIDVISQEKPTVSETDLKKNIAEYRQIADHNPYLADVADMVRKNIRIAVLSEKITTLMTGWQVQELKVINEQIKNDRIEGIDQQILKQFKEMLEEAEKNPNIVAEKQAEAKKAKKGGKK